MNNANFPLKKRINYFAILAIILLIAGAVAFYYNSLHSNKQHKLPASVQEEVENLSFQYNRDHNINPLDTGDILDLSLLEQLGDASKVEPNRKTLLTFGSVASPPVKHLHDKLGNKLQTIHVIYNADDLFSENVHVDKRDLEGFAKNSILITAKPDSPEKKQKMSEALAKLGVSTYGYSYLLDESSKVIYQDNMLGLDVDATEKNIMSYLNKTGTPQSRKRFKINDSLGKFLPPDQQLKYDEFVSEGYTVVMISSSLCSACKNWLTSAEKYITQWNKENIKVVKVEFDLETNDKFITKDRIMSISKKIKPEDSKNLPNMLNVRVLPLIYILKDGLYQGTVNYRLQEVNGKPYDDLQFRSVSDILAGNKF